MPPDTPHFVANLLVASAMVVLTTTIHFFAMLALTVVLRRVADDRLEERRHLLKRFAGILFVVLGVFFAHTVEIWSYALLFRYPLGLFGDIETALYFATQSFISLGYGDVPVPTEWRLVGAIAACNGLILVGWSTAFLISVMGRLRALEHEWLDH